MSRCEKIQELLSAMLDGELSQADAAEVQAHIAECGDCRAMYQAFAAVSAAVSAEEDVPADLHEKIMSTVKAAEKATKTQKKLVRLRTALSLAACLVVIVGTVFAVGRSGLLRMGRADNFKSAEVNTAALPQMSTYSVTAGSGSGSTDAAYDAAPAAAPESWDELEPKDAVAETEFTAASDGSQAPLTMTVELTERIDERTYTAVVPESADQAFAAGETVTLYLDDEAETIGDPGTLPLPALVAVEYYRRDGNAVCVSGVRRLAS